MNSLKATELRDVESRVTLEQLSHDPRLTKKERRTIDIAVKVVREEGRVPTYEEIGKEIFVTKARVSQIFDSIYRKCPELSSINQ